MRGPSVVLSTAALFARPLAATFALAAECGYTRRRGHGDEGPREPGSDGDAPPRRRARSPYRGDPRAGPAADPLGVGNGPGRQDRHGHPRGQGSRDPVGGHAPPLPLAAGLSAVASRVLGDRRGSHRRDGGDREHVPGAYRVQAAHAARQPGSRSARRLSPSGARHVARRRRPARSGRGSPASSETGCATSTSPTTRARGGTRTSRPARACSTWTRSCSISRASDFTGVVSLEVDLRKHTPRPRRPLFAPDLDA